MKKFLKITLLLLLLQLVWTGADVSAADTDSTGVCAVENTFPSDTDTLTSLPENPVPEVYSYPMDQTTSSGLQSMSRRMRTVSSRSQFLTRGNILFVKGLIGQLSRYQSMLTACANRTYTSFRLSYWNVPADCYVYGIRHIII